MSEVSCSPAERGVAEGARPVACINGDPVTLDSLPPPGTKRWVARRKAEVVTAVRAGLLSFDDACQRYNLSPEEFASWERAIDRHGMGGLRVTRIQEFR